MMDGYFRIFLRSVKFTDVIDVLIVAVFIYLLLVWLKKARARFIFIGMVILGAVYVLARSLGFYMTTVAFQAFFAVALIMAVIIFQDDLRIFLERIAVFGVTRRHRAVASSGEKIDIISSATANLSRKKMGALLVIKGTDPMDRHLEAGIIVDAVISEVLIESIFDRHVPSHDGAVVIDGSRIAKLGCHLPLSTNIKEVGRLGTRHAAGLGITERTDALSIVVSEEEGTVSVAEDGRMKTLKDSPQVMTILKDFYRRKFPEKKDFGFKRFFTEHYLEKILAIVIACSLWMAFGQRTEIIRRDVMVPLEYRQLAQDRIIDEPKVKEVTLTLSGTEQEFNLLKSKELKVSLDMSNIKDGENLVNISKELVRNSAGLSVVNIDPDRIVLKSYRLLPHVVKVEARTSGKPSGGVRIRNVKVEPSSVQVLAPSTIPADRISAQIDPVDLSPIKEDTVVVTRLKTQPEIAFPQGKVPEIRVIIDTEKAGEN